MASAPRLLEGIRVIDAASFIAGPVATTVMADFGADVIKIEPPGGDTYRTRGPGYPPSPYNFPWIVDNRSKRGVAIVLRTEDGQRVLHRLVGAVDVFVTNVPLDARPRLRVGWDDLAPLNPRLIYASVTAYGETGEEKLELQGYVTRCYGSLTTFNVLFANRASWFVGQADKE